MPNIIALIDCDCFFVSCERIENPDLHGKPVCVVTGENGCIVSRSKEAKNMGVKMGQPLFMAKKEYPNAIYINTHHSKYEMYSAKVMECLRTFTPDVEVCSIDEAYINLSGLEKLYKKNTEEIAKDIRKNIWEKCKIPVSIGIGTSKTLAKLASDKAKSGTGVFCIKTENLPEILTTTPLDEVCGFGKQNTTKMQMLGVFNCAEFTQNTDTWVRKNLGIKGLDLKYELLGYMVHKVSSVEEKPKSIQDTSALTKFTSDEAILRASLKYHVHCASRKLREEECFCKNVGVLLRTKDFIVSNENIKLNTPTNGEKEIFEAVLKAFKRIYNPNILYRSTGVILDNLLGKDEYQPSLFNMPEYNDDKISRAIDECEKKFGKNIIKSGLF